MPDENGDWSVEADCQRYERLLAQVQSGRFWTVDQPARPSGAELKQQIEPLRHILDQLHTAANSEQ